MSLVELWREFAVGYERRRYEKDRDTYTAWSAAAFVWSKKLPKLEDVLSKRPQPVDEKKKPGVEHKQTVGQQKAMLHILSALYGYPMKVGRES